MTTPDCTAYLHLIAQHAGVHLGVHHFDGAHGLEEPEVGVVEEFAEDEFAGGMAEHARHFLPVVVGRRKAAEETRRHAHGQDLSAAETAERSGRGYR